MRDGVADVLAQRAALDRGAGIGIFVSLLLHGGLTALGVYAATHAVAPKPARMVQIQFASTPKATMPAPVAARPAAPTPAPAPTPLPKVEAPKPTIEEPKPIVEQTPAKPQKNTVPIDAFGRSTKKGSEAPATEKPAPPPAAPAVPGVGTTTAVPVGGSGVTGLEGGDFPYTLYIQAMQRRIGTNWFRPQAASGIATVIYFRILRDGTITEAKVETPSGNPTFDRAALSAVRSSTPLNPLPFGYNGTYLGVRLAFR